MVDKEIMKLAREIFNDQVKGADAMFETLENLSIPNELIERYTTKQLANTLVSAVLFEINWQFKPMSPAELRQFTYDKLVANF